MFSLDEYLKERGTLIDEALDQHLPSADTRPAVLHDAIRYSLFTGGKRLRPILCMAAAEAVGRPPEAAIMPAVAIELLHTYTLIHDDLPCMDDDTLRRGHPTVHIKYGEANAVLAGDALQAMAFELLAKPPAPSAQLVLELAQAAGSQGVVGGQVEDMIAAGLPPDEAAITFIHTHKTADLFRAALRMGAIAANAGSEDLEALTRYGTNLGLAFQITDDLLDEGDSGPDSETTCLMVFDAETAYNKAEHLVGDAISILNRFDDSRVEPLKAIARFVLDRTY